MWVPYLLIPLLEKFKLEFPAPLYCALLGNLLFLDCHLDSLLSAPSCHLPCPDTNTVFFWNRTYLPIISHLFCLLFVQLCPKGKACCLVIRNELSVIWKKCGDKRSNWLHSWFTRRSIASLSRDLLRSGAPWCSATMSFFFSLSTTITFFFPQQ